MQITLKVLKGAQAWEFFRFSLACFALNEPIWVCDLGTGEKNRIFYQLTADFDGFWFFAAYWVCGKQEKNLKLGQNLKLVVVVFEPISMPTMCFFGKILKFWFFYECLKNLRRINFLPHTQQAWNNFYRILSRRGIIFTAYSVGGE